MAMQLPLVSIVIPTYNHARYVGFAVESALAQTYPNVEILVIDDGSTDNTQEVLQPYKRGIKYLPKSNGGTPNALNYGINRTMGKYICWLSADDVFRPEKVAKQVALMESQITLGFCYTGFTVIDGSGTPLYDVHSAYYPHPKEMVQKLVEGNFINGSSVMMRKEALGRTGWFDEGLAQAHDHDLWFRLLCKYRCGFLDEMLLAYRWHGENMSQHPDTRCEEIVKQRARRLFPEWLP